MSANISRHPLRQRERSAGMSGTWSRFCLQVRVPGVTQKCNPAQMSHYPIRKPISVAALMTLFDRGEFKPGDPLKKFIPQFAGDHRDQGTVQHLLVKDVLGARLVSLKRAIPTLLSFPTVTGSKEVIGRMVRGIEALFQSSPVVAPPEDNV